MGKLVGNNEFEYDAMCKELTIRELSEKHALSETSIRNWYMRRNLSYKCGKTKPSFNMRFFDQESPAFAYVLGWFAADGCVKCTRKKPASIILALKATDAEMLHKIAKLTDNKTPLAKVSYNDTRTEKTYDRVVLSFHSVETVACLAQYGITQAKSLTLQYPNLPLDVEKYFIRGYLEGDGYISKIKNTKSCVVGFCGTKDFLKKLQERIAQLLQTNLFGSIYDHGKIWKLEYRGGKNTKRLLDCLYKDSDEDMRLTRKYKLYIECYGGMKTKMIQQLDLHSGEVLMTFQTCREACTALGRLYTSSITDCCRGKIKTSCGFKWRYVYI